MKTHFKKTKSSVFCLALSAMIIFWTSNPLKMQAQWNTNTSENILISTLTTADLQQVATTDGKTWIAFYHETGSNYDMRAQLIDADGFKLLGPDGVLVDNHTSGSATYVFSVCVDASNNLIIGMQDERSGPDEAVAYKISQTGEKLWGDGIVLGQGLAPYPATLSNGETVIVWNETVSGTLKFHKITTAGTLAWASPKSITVGSTKTTRGQVIANNDGKFSIVYQKKAGGISTTLYAQMFDNAGTALFAPLQICSQTTSAARYYSIAAEADTTFFGYYSSTGNRFNSFLQRINPDGTIPWGMNGSNFNTAVGTNDNYQVQTSINLTPGSDFVWSVCTFCNPNQTMYGVYVQKFKKTDGTRQFTDLAKVVYPISGSSDQLAGDIALVYDTPMFMSYNSTYKMYATRLDASGNFVWPGNKVEISSTTASGSNPKMRYGFTPDGPSRCAGSWTENRGLGYKGYAQGISIGGVIGVVVATQNSVPAIITTNGGTLQMVSTVFPAAANQSVTWSIVPGTGMATISAGGLVTAISNGTVYAKAVTVQDTTVSDSLMITISGQSAAPPTVVTLSASDITPSLATLNGTVNANNLLTDVSFEWGLNSLYGNTVDAIPASVSGTNDTPVLAYLSGLQSNTLYHFRAKGTNLAGTTYGEDLTFTTSTGVGINEKEGMILEIHPVPNDGHFSISIRSSTETDFTLDVYNNLGSKIFTKSNIYVNGTCLMDIDLRPLSGGLYNVILRSSGNQVVRKIMINR